MGRLLRAALLTALAFPAVSLEAISSPEAWDESSAAVSEPFDCTAGLNNWERGWSSAKKHWCCAHKQVGCPFDCDAGFSNWKNGWSAAKKDWCCSAQGVACPPVVPVEPVTAAPRAHTAPRYAFVGYGSALVARKVCRSYGGMPMPKTDTEQHALQATINAAVEEGNLTQTWPNNTFWLGAHWSQTHRRWEWDDGSTVGVHRAAAASLEGIGASSRADQSEEPYMCQMLDGKWHDSLPVHPFGIVCELREGDAIAPVSEEPTPSATKTSTLTRTATTSTTVTTKTSTTVTTSLTSTRSTSTTTTLTKTTTVSTTSSTSIATTTTLVATTMAPTMTTTMTITTTWTTMTMTMTTTRTTFAATRSIASPASGPQGWTWLEFNPTKLRGGQAADYAQLSEIWFRWKGSTINLTTANASNPGGFSPSGQGPSMAIDNDFDTKWLDYVKGPLLIHFRRVTQVDEFGFTTADDLPSRDPIQWTLKGSIDGEDWTLLHLQDSDYTSPLSRKTAINPIPLARAVQEPAGTTAQAPAESTESSEIDVVADDSLATADDTSSLNTREQIIGGAVGGSVGAVAVGLLGGLLGGLLTTEAPTSVMPNSWPPTPETTTTTTASTSILQVTFVTEPTADPRFLSDGAPISLGSSWQRRLSSTQLWMWAAVAVAALSVAACMLVGFQTKGRTRGGRRGSLTRSATIEDMEASEREVEDEESAFASVSLIRKEMTGSQMMPAGQPDAFDLIDQNHDGVISRAEFEAARRFEIMDQNHDGVISREEWEAAARHSVAYRGHAGGSSVYIPLAQPSSSVSTHMQMAPVPPQPPFVASVQMPPGMFTALPLQPLPPMAPPLLSARVASPRASVMVPASYVASPLTSPRLPASHLASPRRLA